MVEFSPFCQCLPEILYNIDPDEHWNDIEYAKFLAIVKSKHQERLNEEI